MKKRVRILAALICLQLILLPVVGAGEKLDTPRATSLARGSFRVMANTPETGLSVQGFRPGNAGRLSVFSSWITSDFLPDDFTTDIDWFEFESLGVVVWFFTDKSKDVNVTVTVLNENKTPVIEDRFSDAPFQNDITGFLIGLGSLNPGFYQIKVKFKQGKKSVGIRYWIQVLPDPNPLVAL